MNERIREIFLACGCVEQGSGHDYSDFDQKKFAQWIVADVCGVLVETMESRSAVIIEKYFGANDAA
jgi:hypothetical protein